MVSRCGLWFVFEVLVLLFLYLILVLAFYFCFNGRSTYLFTVLIPNLVLRLRFACLLALSFSLRSDVQIYALSSLLSLLQFRIQYPNGLIHVTFPPLVSTSSLKGPLLHAE
jgi:hypothetical protein